MELQIVKPQEKQVTGVIRNLTDNLSTHQEQKIERKNKPFIEANTTEVSLSHLKQDCIIPVFSKDNESTISHQEFIDVAFHSVQKVLKGHRISTPEIRVSHTIKGRTPDAIGKPAKELLEHEKTIYYERMAFVIEVPGITESINGNQLNLSIGGVRAYNQENLYSKKAMEKFKFFIGFKNMVCCNMCISSDGYAGEIKVSSLNELQNQLIEIISSYKAQEHLKLMQSLSNHKLTERQFAQLIGKARLYQYLPKSQKAELPELLINDSQISTVAKDYYHDESFCRDDSGDINLWNLYNLFTGAVKSSYIDSFVNRNMNAFSFTNELSQALKNDSKHQWFLS
ncbi:DUF3871 family protein [Pontimicrobium sp. IMCC45349]|uniref:DUF3871 family protein n=1 Tax=Pontimicrobium sp. IMCC45349 TaxID=3391574 RepID=UPI00399F3611